MEGLNVWDYAIGIAIAVSLAVMVLVFFNAVIAHYDGDVAPVPALASNLQHSVDAMFNIAMSKLEKAGTLKATTLIVAPLKLVGRGKHRRRSSVLSKAMQNLRADPTHMVGQLRHKPRHLRPSETDASNIRHTRSGRRRGGYSARLN